MSWRTDRETAGGAPQEARNKHQLRQNNFPAAPDAEAAGNPGGGYWSSRNTVTGRWVDRFP